MTLHDLKVTPGKKLGNDDDSDQGESVTIRYGEVVVTVALFRSDDDNASPPTSPAVVVVDVDTPDVTEIDVDYGAASAAGDALRIYVNEAPTFGADYSKKE